MKVELMNLFILQAKQRTKVIRRRRRLFLRDNYAAQSAKANPKKLREGTNPKGLSDAGTSENGGNPTRSQANLVGNLRPTGLGAASRVFTVHLLDRLQSSFNPIY